MPHIIENSADCKIHCCYSFCNAKDVNTVNIHWQISEKYVENIIIIRMTRKSVEALKYDGTNMHNEKQTRSSFLIICY